MNNRNILILIITLSMSSACWSQRIYEIHYPSIGSVINTNTIEPDTGESIYPTKVIDHFSIIDEVSTGYKDLYFELTAGDTIREFFYSSDSTYQFRETIGGVAKIRGEFKIWTLIDTSLHWPLGQYEEVVRFHKRGVLKMTGRWYDLDQNLSGVYENGFREGLWEQHNPNELIEYYYRKGELIKKLNTGVKHE